MKAYFGGQIREDSRGDLAAVVRTNGDDDRYHVLLYDVSSIEFTHLTGVGTVQHPITRVYMQINHDAGERVIRQAQDKEITELDLRGLDHLVVEPHFVFKNHPAPETVILQMTSDGNYKVQ